MPAAGATACAGHDEDPVDDTGHLPELAARLGARAHRAPRRVSIATDGGRLSALDWVDDRDAESPEFLFAHGGGLNAHSWDAVALLIDRPVRAIDLPGHGWSDWRDDADYRATTIAPALAAAAPHARPWILVGHSLGGLTSLQALAHLPTTPTALVIVDISPATIGAGGAPPPGVFEPGLSFASRAEAVDWAETHGLGRSRESLALGIGFNTRRRDDGRYIFRHHLTHLPFDPDRFDRDPDLHWSAFDPAVPTVLVQASRGAVTDAQAAEVRERAPWVRIARVDSGHNVHSQAPEFLAGLLAALRAELA